MKWLNNIFKGGATAERSSLSLKEVDSWLAQHEDPSGFAERLNPIYNRMEKAAVSLSRDISDLNSAQPDASTPPKLLRAGLAARGEVAKQLDSLCEKLEPPHKRDPDNAFQHHWTALKGLERTVTTFGRAQRYVAALFPKNIERINSDLAEISRVLVDLEQEMKKKRKLSEEIFYARQLSEELQKELPRLEQLQESIRQNEAGLADLKSRLSNLEDEAGRHSRSDEGRRAEELKRELERALTMKSQAEEELAELVSPLSKALSRMAKQGSSSRISLQHDGLFQRLLKSPAEVRDEEISGSLVELQSHLSRLGLKDKKKEKTLEHIEMLIKNRSLEKARSNWAALEEEIVKTREAIAESSLEEVRIRQDSAQAKKSIKSLESSLVQQTKDLTSSREKATEHEKELEERLSNISGGPVQLDPRREG